MFPTFAFGALSDVDKHYFVNKNIMDNGGFENGQARWTSSAGTFAIVTSGSNLLVGKNSATWDAAASSNTLSYNAISIPNGLKGKNAEAFCSIQTPSGTATHKLQVYDGTNVIAQDDVVSNTTPVKSSVNFIMPSSGTITLRLEAQADEPLVAIDDCYLGEATNIANGLPQDVFSAVIDNSGTPTVSTQNLSFISSLTDNGTGDTTINFVSGVFSQTPACSCSSVGSGDNHNCAITGVTTPTATVLRVVTETATTGSNIDVPFRLICQKQSVDAANIYKPDATALSWSGYHDSTCSFPRTSASFGDPTADASCALTQLTNNNFGTVSTVGSVLPAISFVPKKAGRYYACATLVTLLGTTGGANARLVHGSTSISENHVSVAGGNRGNFTLCGIFNVTSLSAQTLEIETAHTGGGTITIDNGGSPNAHSINWQVFAIDQRFPMPQLTNSVSTAYSGVLKQASAVIDNNGTASVNLQYGDAVSSASRTAAGRVTVTFKSGFFSAAPICMCTAQNDTGVARYVCGESSAIPATSTTFSYETVNGAETLTDRRVNISCFGPG